MENKGSKRKPLKFKKKHVKTKAEKEEEMINSVSAKIGISSDEVKIKHANFMSKYPSGKMTRNDLIAESKEFLDDDNRFLAGSLFRVFDEDRSGSLEFPEFMIASHCTSLNSSEKLGWIFNVFDADSSGTIDIVEVGRVMKAVFKVSGAEVDQEVTNACIQNVIDALDEDHDGEVSKEEFIKNSMSVAFIAELLKDEDTQSNGFMDMDKKVSDIEIQ